MISSQLVAFKGTLDCAKAVVGINAATANARRLAEDAQMLLDAGRYASAISLAALAIEESGKTSILRAILLTDDAVSLKSEWKRYRTHTSKNCHWILSDLVAQGAKSLDDLRGIYDEQSDHPKILDQLKQLGFYTDCFGEHAHWSVPDEVIDAALATEVVRSANRFAGRSFVSERELQLWVEHMKPVWKRDLAGMKAALITCYAAMQSEGLLADGPNKMDEFVSGTSPSGS